MSEYDVALDAKTDWLYYWASDQGFNTWDAMEKFVEEESVKQGVDTSGYLHGVEELALCLVPVINADCYYWSREMVEIVKSAAKSIPDNWSLEKRHLPSAYGFYYLASELERHQAAYAWSLLSIDEDKYYDLKDPIKTIGVHVNAEEGKIPEYNAINLVTFVKMAGVSRPVPFRTEMLVGQSLDVLRKHEELVADLLKTEHKEVDRIINDCRMFAAMLSFLQQRILIYSRESVSRAARRRAEIKGRNIKPEVNVVRLRKAQYHSRQGEGREVDWSCRWIVHGHWRNQWYATEQKNHPVFINSFIKGPEDKPLKDPGRLFAVVR
jgi:hypothetical protein